ncbi:MAG: hypothetical protein BM557_08135 [Flavobacterium sp. MedPE-SWcel]|uniref:hypothetical protein n=1 Tax=uncultured Flavobacterium sp. TaxID=165435 RepID=UPI000912AB4A|nr:hypothetical protein [uncultured Flavobacterium sp.]OIQ17650.1 MAG: hypothetical protein BM557_08135 [Flavobacterium sp. MedPE-SWcel]
MRIIKVYGFISLIAFWLLLSCSAKQNNSNASQVGADMIPFKGGPTEAAKRQIGTYDAKGNLKITANLSKLKMIFENRLKENGYKTTVAKVEIKEGIIEGTSEKYFYLIGVSEGGGVKIVTRLFASSNGVGDLVADMSPSNMFKKTCVCVSTCKEGCNPDLYLAKDGFVHWKCTPCSNTKDCRKTVTDSL